MGVPSSRLYPNVAQAFDTFFNCLANSNSPTFVRMTFSGVVIVLRPFFLVEE